MEHTLPAIRLLLIRHGQARGSNAGYGPTAPLTEYGLMQAQHIASTLRSEQVQHIYSSPFHRAAHTALPTRERLQCPYTEDGRLVEFQMGNETEIPIEEMVAKRMDLMLWRPNDQLTEGSETLGRFQTRVSSFLDDLVASHTGQTVAVFTHAGTIAAAMRWAYGLTPEHSWHSDVEVFNASLTEIQHWPSGRHPQGAPFASAVLRLNDVRHLPPDLITEF